MIIKISVFVILKLFHNFVLGDDLLRSASPSVQKIGMTFCDADADCESYINGTCVQNFCLCNGSMNCIELSQTVVNKIGERCIMDSDCNIEHAVCNSDQCECKSDRVVSSDQRKCLEMADSLGDTCEETVQCSSVVKESECQDKKCRCQSRMHAYNGICYDTVGIGGECAHQGECAVTAFSECLENKCRCKQNYIANAAANKCLKVVQKIGSPCYEDIQCSYKLGKAFCKDGHCKCDEMYQYKQTRKMCVRDLLLGETCEDHPDCHGLEPGDRRLECILGECKCKSEYVEVYGYCTSGSMTYSNVVEFSFLCTFLLGVVVFHNSNIWVWIGLFLSILYVFWITVIRSFFENNNYPYNRQQN